MLCMSCLRALTRLLQVVDHYEKPRNVGAFNKSDANVGTGLVGAPACGDVMKLQIRVSLHIVEHSLGQGFRWGTCLRGSHETLNQGEPGLRLFCAVCGCYTCHHDIGQLDIG